MLAEYREPRLPKNKQHACHVVGERSTKPTNEEHRWAECWMLNNTTHWSKLFQANTFLMGSTLAKEPASNVIICPTMRLRKLKNWIFWHIHQTKVPIYTCSYSLSQFCCNRAVLFVTPIASCIHYDSFYCLLSCKAQFNLLWSPRI